MASSLPEILGLPSFDSTFGAVFLGLVVGNMLYGLTIYQAYKYYTVYSNDRIGLKIYITVILAFETFHSVLWIIVAYHYLITEAFNAVGLLHAHWSVRLTVLTTGTLVFVSQMFYAHRVYHVGPRGYLWLVVPAIVSMFIGLGFAIAAGIEAFTVVRYITDSKRLSWLVSVAYGFAFTSDIIVTGGLVFVLQRSRTGSKRSNTVLDILIKYTINTGLLTSIFSVLVFISAIVLPGDLVYAGVSIVGAKLYANSVLAVVNSRKSIGNKFFDDFTTQGVPVQSRVDIELESMAWNVHQPTTVASGMAESIITSQGVSFVMSADTATEKPMESDEKRRHNSTMTA